MSITEEQLRLIAAEIREAKGAAEAIATEAARRRGIQFSIEVLGRNAQPEADTVASDAAARLAALAAVTASPFFCRVTAITQIDRKPMREGYLFSKVRFPGVLPIDDREEILLSWTSPLYATLRGARPGRTVEIEDPSGSVRHVVESSSDWSVLLPMAEGIVVRTGETDLHVARETDVSLPVSIDNVPADSEPARSAVSEPQISPVKRGYGLGEIIALADASQRSVMHLPFLSDVLVEGPPGSGKTSVGLMRIPCLLDRQWDELRLNPGRDPAFHTQDSMRVLVMNPEMVPYLERLMRDIAIPSVSVQTLGDFCRDVCKRVGLQVLTGVPRRCSRPLEQAKFSIDGLAAFTSAFKSSVKEYWIESGEEIKQKFTDIHPKLGQDAHRRLEKWISSVLAWDLRDDAGLDPSLRIGQALNDWAFHCLRELSPADVDIRMTGRNLASINDERARGRDAVRRISAMCNTILKHAVDRKRITERLQAAGQLTDAMIDEWRQQALRRADAPATCSEGDYALHGLLAAMFLMSDVPRQEKALIGARMPSLTHVAIDEAQDISSVHVYLLRTMLSSKGSLTLVGDLRQRIDGHGYFETWNHLPLREPRHAAFAVNHRQTMPIGNFVRDEHRRLYGADADWRSSSRPGPDVRRLSIRASSAGDVIGAEVLHWVREFPDSNCGVLFVDDHDPETLAVLRDEVEAALHDELVTVDLAIAESSERQLRKESGVILAPVGLTKGLEFDVVILVSRMTLDSYVDKNRHYVGCSRARTALTVIDVD